MMDTIANYTTNESGQNLIGSAGLQQSKIGTVVPNRIFVGGLSPDTTEHELKEFFSAYGTVKDAKIIHDKLGTGKGSYGFVTFESQELAERIIKSEAESLIFKERKINISHAIKKQHILPVADISSTLHLISAGNNVPFAYQNSIPLCQLPITDYSLLTQPLPNPYSTFLLPHTNVNGAPFYFPNNQNVAQPNIPTTIPNYSTSVTNSVQSTSAILAMANAIQKQATTQATTDGQPASSSPVNGSVTAANQGGSSHVANPTAATPATAMTHPMVNAQHQVAQQALAIASLLQGQQAPGQQMLPWPNHQAAATARWPQQSAQTVSPVAQQNSPPTYVYNPATNGQEVMLMPPHQALSSSPYVPNSTSDYSTDYSNLSSSLLDNEVIDFNIPRQRNY